MVIQLSMNKNRNSYYIFAFFSFRTQVRRAWQLLQECLLVKLKVMIIKNEEILICLFAASLLLHIQVNCMHFSLVASMFFSLHFHIMLLYYTILLIQSRYMVYYYFFLRGNPAIL